MPWVSSVVCSFRRSSMDPLVCSASVSGVWISTADRARGVSLCENRLLVKNVPSVREVSTENGTPEVGSCIVRALPRSRNVVVLSAGEDASPFSAALFVNSMGCMPSV